MISEMDYRLQCFGKRLAQFAGKRIALYGTGVNAAAMLEHFASSLNIVALVSSEGGELLNGVRAVTLDEAFSRDVQVLVIAAQVASCQVVYERVADACKAHGVCVFDMYGNRYDILYAQVKDALLSEDEHLADDYDFLSVDASLVAARTLAKDNVSESWARAGLICERVCRRALGRGVSIVFIADCDTLDESAIRALLDEAGFSGQPLFSRDELGVGKTGGLYRAVIEQCPHRKALHIGYDFSRDGVAPRIYGIDTMLYDEDDFDGDDAPDGMQADALLEALHVSRRPSVYDALAALTVGFTGWLASQLGQTAVDEVLFVSRDGWILKQAYDAYCKAFDPAGQLPPSRYFLTSRCAASLAWMGASGMRHRVARMCAGMSLREAVKSSLNIDLPDGEGLAVADEQQIVEWQRANAELVESSSRACRQGLLAHAHAQGISPDKAYACVDCGGAGATQTFLGSILGCRLKGFYINHVPRGNTCDHADIKSYMTTSDEAFQAVYESVEPYFSAPHPAVHVYEPDGNVVYGPELRSKRELAEFDRASSAIHDKCMAALAHHELWDDGLVGHAAVEAVFARADLSELLLDMHDDWTADKGNASAY